MKVSANVDLRIACACMRVGMKLEIACGCSIVVSYVKKARESLLSVRPAPESYMEPMLTDMCQVTRHFLSACFCTCVSGVWEACDVDVTLRQAS